LEAIKIFLQLRAGFEVLFEEKILHRDLKPSNILFHNGVVKIADFGFCKEMMENDMAQTMVGSPIYMAPEILKGSVYDHRADIWSLGVILYEMMYGFCPYEENSITKLINLIDNNLLKFPPEVSISNHVKILMKRMMTIKYRERISPK
jgi:serine/threonine protein kinase